jgi:hypothetical protein
MRPLILPALLLLVPLAGAAALPDPVARFPLLLALLAPATAGWLLGVRRAACAPGTRGLALVLAVGAAVRIVWVAGPPPLSDDLYRYLWDGRVGNAGVHPFAHAPSAPELAELRDDAVWPHINHPDVPTIYPPVAQGYFRLLDRTAPTPTGARAAAALLDLLGAVLLALLLRARGRPAALAAAAAWCPLAVLESAGGGHVDALGAALLVGGLLAAERADRARGHAAAGAVLALSALVKPTAALLAPGLLLRGRPARRAALLAGAAAAAALVTLPFLGAGRKLFTGFLTYAEHWRFNDLLYSPLVAAGLTPRGARAALAVAVLAAAIALPLRLRDRLAWTAAVIGTGLALSPTVHPWYALWLVPLLPFLPRAAAPAGFALVALLPISYAAAWTEAVTGVWAEPAWTRPALWGPVLALLAWGPWRRR